MDIPNSKVEVVGDPCILTATKTMKILCLHGFRTSGDFLKKQLSKWDPSIFAHFDLEFPNGMFPAQGKSDVEGIFPPPYFEWFQFDKDFMEYTNLEECISYLCQYITSKGPFHGLLGFSQGASLCGLLLGYQAQGKILKEHPHIRLFISVSGSKFRAQSISEVAYKDAIKVRSVHFIGAKDWLRLPCEEFATAFEDPLIIHHPQGHTIPRLDEEAMKKLREWTKKILKDEDEEREVVVEPNILNIQKLVPQQEVYKTTEENDIKTTITNGASNDDKNRV